MEHILIIDDDVDMCKLLQRFLSRNGYSVVYAHSGKKGLEAMELQTPDLILCDFRLQDTDGKTLLLQIKEKEPDIPVIIITGYSDVKMAVDIMKHGAFDYITKPLFPEEILVTIKKAISLSITPAITDESVAGNGSMINHNHSVKKRNRNTSKYLFPKGGGFGDILKQIELVAPTNYSVIIYGESGSGKESVAQYIHQLSKRSSQPFIAIDCGALSKELAGSELFGHEKGSFTGAINQKTGSLELANGGTVFLDEVANLSYDIQISLLRVVQERKMRRVGGTKDIDLDIRIIVASNEILYDADKKVKFREDLYHRFNEFSINVLPLRNRKEDIMLFADFFLDQVNTELDKDINDFSIPVKELFMSYNWPGNLRELKNVIKRSALLAEKDVIDLHALPFELVNHNKLAFDNHDNGSNKTDSKDELQDQFPKNDTPRKNRELNERTLKEVSIDVEYETIIMALKKANYNKSQAAKILNVDRKTLYNKMKQYKDLNEE